MERIVRPRGQVLRSAAILAALLAAGAASLLTGPAGAADCAGASATVPANADGWIDRGSATANKGSDSILKVQSKQPDVNSRALVRFPLPAAPQGCVVESARLRLYAVSESEGSRLEAARLASTWQESQVTWANQPGTAGDAAATWAGDGYVQWNVTAQIREMLGGANPGFLIRDAAENGAGIEQVFNSREKGENPPRLIVTFR